MEKQLPTRLSAWLLTLIMLVGMLPAMASADEVGEDLAPPAPQEENYGYVRLVFAEGEQLDLCHGEYITECSPTAEILNGADEDFIFNGEYAALYYEGKLYCKAALDGVTAVIFASSLGIGVMLSAVPVLIYQGAIALLGNAVAPLLSDAVITEMSAVGGLLIMGIGVNMLLEKDIKVANLLPAIVVPFLYFPLYDLIMR